MTFVAIVLAFTTVLFFIALIEATRRLNRAQEERDEANARADAAARRLEAAKGAVSPLAWSWDLVEEMGDAPVKGEVRKLRHYLVNAFTSLQMATDLDDLDMAEIMVTVPEPPRRLPRYPQVPPYLASPADVAQIPPMPEDGR